MFSVKLNSESSGSSNKNSCGFIEIGAQSPFSTCNLTYLDLSRPNVIATDLNYLCPIFGTPSGPITCGEFSFGCYPGGYWPNGNGILGVDVCPHSMLPLTATTYCELNEYGQNNCSYSDGYVECSDDGNETPCDGSSNLDYCSCI